MNDNDVCGQCFWCGGSAWSDDEEHDEDNNEFAHVECEKEMGK